MTNRSVMLVLPGLLPSILDELESNVPTLKKILSRASYQKGPTSFEKAIKTLFHGIGNGAILNGPLGAVAAGISQSPFHETWCRVSFLECHIDHQTAYAVRSCVLDPTELRQLIDTFKPFFKEVGLDLHITSEGEWYLAIHQHANVVMNDMLGIIGKSLNTRLPWGADQSFWRRLFTECQMLLSTHRVNIVRRENNHPELSCLWFEGLGSLNNPVTTHLKNVYTDESSVKGLAKLSGITYSSLDDGFTGSAYSAVISQKFYSLLKHQAREEFIKMLNQWEKQWFAPLYQALIEGEIDSIVIDDVSGRQFILKSQYRFYIWRRLKPLSAFTQEYI